MKLIVILILTFILSISNRKVLVDNLERNLKEIEEYEEFIKKYGDAEVETIYFDHGLPTLGHGFIAVIIKDLPDKWIRYHRLAFGKHAEVKNYRFKYDEAKSYQY